MVVTTLIVDDSAVARDWLRRNLGNLGCLVVGEADSASEGLRQFRALRPRLVTLDIMMPEIDSMDSMALFRQIRQKDADAAVLVVSARPLADSHAFLKMGAVGYLEKPFVDFDKVAQLLRGYFPELEVEGQEAGKRPGLSARLKRRL